MFRHYPRIRDTLALVRDIAVACAFVALAVIAWQAAYYIDARWLP